MLTCLYIAVFAVIFNRLLIEEEGIFEFYGRWLLRLPELLAKPLGDCTYCFGGQVALWVFTIRFILTEPFGFGYLLIVPYVCITIFLIHIIAFIWDLIEKQWENK